MTLGLGLVSYIFLIAPYVHDQTLTLLPKLVSIGYPTGRHHPARRRHPPRRRRRQAPPRLLPADRQHRHAARHRLRLRHPHARQRLHPPAVARRRLDLLLPAVGRGGAASVDARAVGRRRRRASRGFTPLRLALLAGATLIAPVLELIKAIPRRTTRMRSSSSPHRSRCSALVVGRMGGLVRQREKSVARERALTAAGGLLVGGTDRHRDRRRGAAGRRRARTGAGSTRGCAGSPATPSGCWRSTSAARWRSGRSTGAVSAVLQSA